MTIAIYILVCVLLVAAALIVHAWRVAMSLRLQHADPRERPCAGLPAYLRVVYAPAVQSLRALGFSPLYCSVGAGTDPRLGEAGWTVVLGNAPQRSYACVATATRRAEMPGTEVSFASVFSDGTLLLTVNRRAHAMPGPLPGTELIDACAAEVAEQWAAHRERLDGLARTRKPVAVSGTVHRTRLRMAMNAGIDRLAATGALRRTDDGVYALSARGAWGPALRWLIGELRLARCRPARARPAAVPVEAEALAFARIEASARDRPYGWLGAVVLFVSAAAAFGVAFGAAPSWHTVLIAVAALLLHQLGHRAALAVSGQRQPRNPFASCAGEAAAAGDGGLRPWQRIAIHAMGPLPGIALGTWLLHLAGSRPLPLLTDAGIVLLTANGLSLLPLARFDGGRILRLALFDRSAHAQAAVVGATGAALLAAAWYFGLPLLGLPGAALMLLAPVQWRDARLLARVRDALPALRQGGRAGVEAVFGAMRGPAFAALGFARRCRLAKAARERLSAPQATRGAALSALAVYLLAVIVPLGVLAVPHARTPLAAGADTARAAAAAAPDWPAALAAARDDAERWQIAQRAAEWHAARDDARAGARYYALALQAADAFGSGDARRARTHVGLAGLAPTAEQARQHYAAALVVQEQASGADSLEVALVLEGLASTYAPSGAQAAQGEALLERAARIREAAGGAVDARLDLLGTLATFREARGDRDGARAALERALALADEAGVSGAERTGRLLERVGTLCALEKKHTCAELMFSRMIELPADPALPDAQRQSFAARGNTRLGWVMFVRGDVRSAQRHFERALEEHILADAAAAPAAAADEPASVPLLLDLVYVHWTRGAGATARELLARADDLVRGAHGRGIAQHARSSADTLAGVGPGAENEWRARRAQAHAEAVAALGAR